MPSPAKPRDRQNAESRAENKARYPLSGFSEDAVATLGIEVNFPPAGQQGVTILDFNVDSNAEAAGLQQFDFVYEVDGAAVGFIHGRYYQPWQHYGRSGPQKAELLVAYVRPTDGQRRFYYPSVPLTSIDVVESYRFLPDDFFTSQKPRAREPGESRETNLGRYVLGYGNFDTYAKYELGIRMDYFGQFGELNSITSVKPGSAAENVLKVGDVILEVDGAPVGQIGERLYEPWRQYIYSKDGKIELLVAYFDPTSGDYRFYYPEVQLHLRTVPA